MPAGAAWCSLCHRDLRPEPTGPTAPDPAEEITVPSTVPRGGTGQRRGRHARPEGEPPDAAPLVRVSAGSGRHAPSAPASTLALLEGIEAPRSADADDEEVEAYAELMLTRLRIADPAPQLADPRSFPGGRWGLAAAAMLAITLALLAVGAVAGAVLG